MQIACVDPTEAGSWINEQVARDVSRQLGLGRITQFNKETKTWLVTFDNGDTDEYTYIEILGAKQLFKDNKDREEGAVIVSIVSAVKRAKPRRTQTEIIASYEDYFNTAMNQLVDNGNDPNKAELSKNNVQQYSHWVLVSMRRPHLQLPSYEKNSRIKYKSPWLSCDLKIDFGLHGLHCMIIDGGAAASDRDGGVGRYDRGTSARGARKHDCREGR